jgi:penicillin-binding protein 2
VILEPAKKKWSPEDDSSLGIRVGVLLIIAFTLFGVLAFRLWFLQILSGDTYVAVAKDNRIREVKIEAPRGVVYDRNGKILVENRAGLSVGILPMDMYDPEKDSEKFQQEISGLARILDIGETDLLAAYEKAKKNPYLTYVVKEDVPENTVVAQIKEHSTQYRGVQVTASYLREYPFGALATHLLGYVGEVSQNDLNQEQFATLKPGAIVGKDGVERTYDSFLRGADGRQDVEVDAAGRPKRAFPPSAPTPGSNLWLTINVDLQEAAENAIVEGIQRAHEQGFKKAAGGAVVAMNPQNGEILALASYPDYDPSLWVGGMSRAKYAELKAEQAHFPLYNRAIDGLYPAGSTFKPFVATAALSTGIVTAETVFHCEGKYSAYRQTWKDWVFPDGEHGDTDLLKAITESCDVYFYNLGNLLYQQPSPVLQDGVRKFGFGQQTGVDLPGETRGSRVPDKYWKAEVGKTAEDKSWKPGDEINLAIGQGDLLVTPIQLAVAVSAIANGGTLWVPHLGGWITDASGNRIHEFQSEQRGTVVGQGEGYITPDILNIVRQGMSQVTQDGGTASGAFKNFPIAVAGKTGTAEKLPEDDYALFIAYAPADVPPEKAEIAVVAIIEQGGHGSTVAAPVVRRVLEAYFHTESSGATIIPVSE